MLSASNTIPADYPPPHDAEAFGRRLLNEKSAGHLFGNWEDA
jgi:hypothetical protein